MKTQACIDELMSMYSGWLSTGGYLTWSWPALPPKTGKLSAPCFSFSLVRRGAGITCAVCGWKETDCFCQSSPDGSIKNHQCPLPVTCKASLTSLSQFHSLSDEAYGSRCLVFLLRQAAICHLVPGRSQEIVISKALLGVGYKFISTWDIPL